MVNRFFMFSLVMAVAYFAANSALANEKATGVTVDASRIGDASHFEFGGTSDWKYDLKRTPQGDKVTLRVPSMRPDAIARLRGHSDALIKNVSIDEKGVDGTTEVTFSIAGNADFFDYLTEQPSRLVVDFFPKDASATTPAPKAKAAAPAKTTSSKLPAKRSVASADDDEDLDDEELDTSGAVRDITAEITGQMKAPKKVKSPTGKGQESDMVVASPQAPPTLAEEISSQKDFSHGIFDGGDPEFNRFMVKDYEIREEAIIASRSNFYLPFPMLDLGNQQLKNLIGAPPTYEIIEQDTRENKEARIILNLFKDGKRALFRTTAAEFLKKYPTSQYDEIIRSMVADTHESMWREKNSVTDFEAAMASYQLLTEKYPDSPISARTLLYMGYAYVERGDSFGAQKAFQRFLRLHPESKHVDRVNISIAEAYLRLNRYDDTYSLLDKIEKTASTPKGKHEAAFRKGNVYFRQRDWNEAIKQYQSAITKYPDATSNFPNAYYNVAEAQFRLGRYRESLESYRKFLQKFPDHEHGGYAMTRMGELLGVLGADPKRAQGAFLESFFRYRATPGAGVARIRTLVTRLPEMKDKELAAALFEIKQLTDKYSSSPVEEKEEKKTDAKAEGKTDEHKTAEASGEHGEKAEVRGPASEHASSSGPNERFTGLPEKRPELPGIEEFTTLLLADAWTARKEYDSAAKDLISYYQKNPQSPNKDRITSRIVNNLTLGIREAVDHGDFMEGLRRYSRNSSGWLKNANRVDVRYDVARSYEQAGVYKEAATVYRECVKKLAEIKSAGKEKEQAVFENLPKADQLNLRLAAVSAKEKDYAQAESYLRNISSKPALSEPEMIESAEIAAEVAEARGKVGEARNYLASLIKTWKGDAELTSPLHLRIAKLDGAKKNFKDADEHLVKILDLRAKGGRVSDDVYAGALELRGDLMAKRGKPLDAIKSYRDLIEQFDGKRPVSSIRYRLGQLLYQTGDLKSAQSAWGELNPERDGLWARLATEQMQGAKWQREYKKYLSRIPAAADLRK